MSKEINYKHIFKNRLTLFFKQIENKITNSSKNVFIFSIKTL